MAALANDLPVGYYRDNFKFLLDFVLARYADLLSPAEQAYASGFGQLSLPAQRLYVRLALRKGPVFRSDKIAYAEIPACAAAAAELMAAGYVDAGADAAYEVLLGLLVMPELRRLGPGLAGSGRAALVASLLASTTVADFHASISLRSIDLATWCYCGPFACCFLATCSRTSLNLSSMTSASCLMSVMP